MGRVQFLIGCDAPSMHGIDEPLCGNWRTYRNMLDTHWETPSILSYQAHKQLLYCVVLDEEINLGSYSFDASAPNDEFWRTRSEYQTAWDEASSDRTPLTLTLRTRGLAFGKCFCKFGSRQGTHPSQGYENIVPRKFSDVCPL